MYLSSDCTISRSVTNLHKHPVSLLRSFSNQNFEKKVSVVHPREVSVSERAQLQRDKWNSAGTRFAVRLRKVSALESVGLERIDCNLYLSYESTFFLCLSHYSF